MFFAVVPWGFENMIDDSLLTIFLLGLLNVNIASVVVHIRVLKISINVVGVSLMLKIVHV